MPRQQRTQRQAQKRQNHQRQPLAVHRLGAGAWAAIQKKDSPVRAQYRRLAPRRGKKRSALAVAHSLIAVIFHMLNTGSNYKELDGDYFNKLNQKRLVPYFLKRLTELGYQVTLKAA